MSPPPVPYTAAMQRKLDLVEPTARVVGVQHGLPLVEFVSGRRLVLTTTGHFERA